MCTSVGVVGCLRGVCAHGEDLLGGHGGADRVVVSARVSLDRAPRSAHDEAGLAALRAAPAQRLAAGQTKLDLGVAERSASEPLPITSSRSAHLWDALCRAYDVLGFDAAAGADEVFRQLVLARIIEPTSQTCIAAGARRDRGGRPVLSDAEPTTARVCQTGFPAGAFEGMCGSRGVGADVAGAL